jgi:dihydrofolate reductase
VGIVRVNTISVSIDGFAAGADQDAEHPLGIGGELLHTWIFETRFGRAMIGAEVGSHGIDNEFLVAGEAGVGATVMGRNMFGPVRDAWPDAQWRGWWGDDPPFHHPVFVLTHHARAPIEMEGGTTFQFVTDGIEAALARATEAAQGEDVRIGGGAATIREYLQARLIDEMHLALVPVVLGRGEPLLEGLDLRALGYEVVEYVASGAVFHVRLKARTGPPIL